MNSELLAALRSKSERGDVDAQYQLGRLIFESKNGDDSIAIRLLKQAADKDQPEACYLLSRIKAGGFGPPDNDQNAQLLTRAAKMGVIEAQRDLGCYYCRGDSFFKKDLALGRQWYLMAAQQGDSDAQYNYGIMAFMGEGGPVDREMGRKYLQLAHEGGEENALIALVDLENSFGKAQEESGTNI